MADRVLRSGAPACSSWRTSARAASTAWRRRAAASVWVPVSAPVPAGVSVVVSAVMGCAPGGGGSKGKAQAVEGQRRCGRCGRGGWRRPGPGAIAQGALQEFARALAARAAEDLGGRAVLDNAAGLGEIEIGRASCRGRV